MTTDDKNLQLALSCARGYNQRALVEGDLWGTSHLKGKAKNWSGSYLKSQDALLDRLIVAGVVGHFRANRLVLAPAPGCCVCGKAVTSTTVALPTVVEQKDGRVRRTRHAARWSVSYCDKPLYLCEGYDLRTAEGDLVARFRAPVDVVMSWACYMTQKTPEVGADAALFRLAAEASVALTSEPRRAVPVARLRDFARSSEVPTTVEEKARTWQPEVWLP